MLWLLSGPLGFTNRISFALVFSCFAVESLSLLYLLLYLDLYVLGDDALISSGLSCKPKSIRLDPHLK